MKLITHLMVNLQKISTKECESQRISENKKYSILLNDVEKDENISIENNYYGNYVCLNRKKLKNDIDYYREKILIIRKLNKIFTKKDPVILEK